VSGTTKDLLKKLFGRGQRLRNIQNDLSAEEDSVSRKEEKIGKGPVAMVAPPKLRVGKRGKSLERGFREQQPSNSNIKKTPHRSADRRRGRQKLLGLSTSLAVDSKARRPRKKEGKFTR